MRKRREQRGSSMLEFTLVGVPLIFMWISIFQLSIGMWRYHTLQYAVKQSASYIAVHGYNYVSAGNTAIQIKDAAAALKNAAVGIVPSEVSVTFGAIKTDGTKTTRSCQLDACLTDTTSWPPTGYNLPGMDLEIKADYLFRAPIAMVAPGPGSGPVRFGSAHLPGYTRQFILF